MPEAKDRMKNAALRYAGIGWHVFPLSETNDIKAPHPRLVKDGGHNLATTDVTKIAEWWGDRPNAGIGVNLAKSGLIAVDIDPRDSGDKHMRELEAVYGPLNSPVTAATGGGGEHRVYAAPVGLKSPPGGVHKRPGLDLKFNGYIAVSPSPHCSKRKGPDGKTIYVRSPNRYTWKPGKSPFENADFLAYLPDWVLKNDMPSARAVALNGHAHEIDVFAEDSNKCGLSPEKLADALAAVPNTGDAELGYEDWLNVLLGIYHETDGSEEGRQLALAWSERSMKHEQEKFDKSWKSGDIEGKGRAPVTFRFVLKLAKEHNAAVAAEIVVTIRKELLLCPDKLAFTEITKRIKATDLPVLERLDLFEEVRKTYKRLTGNTLSVGEARNLTRYENPELKDTPKWLEGWVYCSREDEFYRVGTEQFVTPSAFNSLFDVHMLSRTDKLEGRLMPETRASYAALNGFEITKVHGRMYAPQQPLFFGIAGVDYINTFTAADFPAVPDTVSAADAANVGRIVNHFNMLVADARDRDIYLSWLAHIVQTNGRVNWTPILQGPQGLGKTFIVSMLGAILGSRNVKIIDPAQLQAPHTDWAEGAIITVIEEVKTHGLDRFDVIDKLKPFIANPMVNVHPKGYKARTVPNTASYMGFSNHRFALPLDKTDSRYFLIAAAMQRAEQVDAFKAANPQYYRLLFAAVNESAGAIRSYFLNYAKHPEFDADGRAPRSAEKDMMTDMNQSDAEHAILELLSVRMPPAPELSATLLDTTRLGEYLAAEEIEAPHTRALRTMLVDRLGFSPLGRHKVGGVRRHYWSRTPARFLAKTDAEVGALIRDYLDVSGL